jgi:HSP20 family protein
MTRSNDTPTPTNRDCFPLFRGNPRAEAPRLGSLRDEIDRLFDLFAPVPAEALSLAGPRGWTDPFPALDLAEGGDGYDLSIELPGLAAKDVEVRLKDGALVISGEKSDKHEEDRADRHISERRWGSFRRSITLPSDADPARIDATFARGVLKLHLPKSPAALASEKTIPVTEA